MRIRSLAGSLLAGVAPTAGPAVGAMRRRTGMSLFAPVTGPPQTRSSAPGCPS